MDYIVNVSQQLISQRTLNLYTGWIIYVSNSYINLGNILSQPIQESSKISHSLIKPYGNNKTFCKDL